MNYGGDMCKPILPKLEINLCPIQVGGTEVTTYVKSLGSFSDVKFDTKPIYSNGKCKAFVCVNDDCGWHLWARKQKDCNWKIIRLCDTHVGSCVSMASPNSSLLKAIHVKCDTRKKERKASEYHHLG